MNLLIVGNGFDLAHSLPTKYTDFLRYCRDYNQNEPISMSDEVNEEFLSFVNDNRWLKYFFRSTEDLDNPRTWIDFEKEIAGVIHDFDIANPTIEHAHYFHASSEITLAFSNNVSERVKLFLSSFSSYNKYTSNFIVGNDDVTDIKSLVNFLYTQLRIFARAFEIYCLKINTMPVDETIITTERKRQIKKAESDIENYAHQARQASGYARSKDDVPKFENMRDEAAKKLSSLTSGIKTIDYLSMSKFDYVLSFNYTDTYERLYGSEKTQYCYIHGKAQNEAVKTNLIFGIDDELSRGEESKNFKWIRFKKYYQRIIFETGSEYKNWLNSSTKQNAHQDYVHIIGHSLDKTDYDVLYEIFSNNRFKIIIYYYCPDDFEDKVQKVIQLLAYKGGNGRDEIIRRVHGTQWSIKFVDQYDETNGLFFK